MGQRVGEMGGREELIKEGSTYVRTYVYTLKATRPDWT